MKLRKVLKVKYKHLDFDTRGVSIIQCVVKTIVKHNYKHVQIDGKVYKLHGSYCLPKALGYLPNLYVEDKFRDVYQDSSWFKELWK